MKKRYKRALAAAAALAVSLSGFGVSAAVMDQAGNSRTTTVEAEIAQFANIIDVSGKVVSGGGRMTLTYLVMAGDTIISVSQQRTTGGDTFTKQIALDGALCEAAGVSTAQLRISGKDINTLTAEIPIYEETEVRAAVANLAEISNSEGYAAYINQFAQMLNLTELAQKPFTDYPEAQYELFAEEKPAQVADMMALKVWSEAYREKAERVTALMKEINDAVSAKKWGVIEKLTTETYADLLDIDPGKADKVKNNQEMFERMYDQTYATRAEIVQAYDQAYTAQETKEKEYNPSYGGSGGSGGSGGGNRRPTGLGGVGSGTVYQNDPEAEEPQPEDNAQDWENLPAALKFDDIDEVDWARTAILELVDRGVVHGNGDGSFEPMRNVTREEMLSMLLNSFRLPEAAGNAEFTDVSPEDWCYEAVMRGQALGIVNGMPDGSFGKGQLVTRADMAVMAVRLVQLLGEELTPVRPLAVFQDFYEIPDYAESGISVLQQAGVINGTDDGRFDPLAGSTRAEAAVLTYNLIQAIGGKQS